MLTQGLNNRSNKDTFQMNYEYIFSQVYLICLSSSVDNISVHGTGAANSVY